MVELYSALVVTIFQILETWLSYIQPWRYTDPAQSNREKDHDIKEKIVEEKWLELIYLKSSSERVK